MSIAKPLLGEMKKKKSSVGIQYALQLICTSLGVGGFKIVADKPPNNCCRQKLTVELKTKRSRDS
jgi:hypothetical protein